MLGSLGLSTAFLSNRGERIVLEDLSGNTADEVTYADSGRWPRFADGGGSSLELRHASADNTSPESWAASDESGESRWETVTYRGVAENDRQGHNVFHEFLLGLLDAGELLLDDVSVIEDPSGRAIEFIQNGDFESDAIESPADKWRVVGTHGSHGHSVVVADPDDPGNRCLHVVATGPTGDKHNKIETTFANRERVEVGTEVPDFVPCQVAPRLQSSQHAALFQLPPANLSPGRSRSVGHAGKHQFDGRAEPWPRLHRS